MKLCKYIPVTLALFCMLFCLSLRAESTHDDIRQLQKKMYDMYSSRATKESDFFSVTDHLKETAQKTGDERTFYRAWSNQALFSANRQKRNQGLRIAKEMQEYAVSHNNKYGIYSSTYVAGCILYMMGSFKEARENLLQAVDYLHENFPNENAVAPYLELAKIEYTQNHPLRTIQYTDQALKEPGIEPRHQLNALSIKCLAIADTSIYKLNTVEYLERFNQVYAEREKIKNQLGRDDIYGADVECWRLINDQKYDEALKVAEKIPSTLIRLEIKQMIYKRMGDYKKAYNTARNHMMIRDSVNSAKNGHLLMEMTSALDLGRVELEAKELKLRNQQMQLEHISDELEQKRLTEEALNLSLKNRDIELANAAIKLQNDSLDQRIQLAKLNEFQSKLHAQEQSERLKLTMLYSAIAIGLLTIAFLCFYLYRRQRAAKRLEEAHKNLQTAYDQLEEHTTARERMQSELRIARDIQMGMVPHRFPRHDAFDLYATMAPAKEVGGDLYDFFVQSNKLYFCIGDVSGKGVPASIVMSVAVNLFRTIAKEGFPPAYIATKLNDTLSADNESGMFVTMFIGIIDLQTGHFEYCNAGHNPPLINGEYIQLETNAPIGLWPELEFVGEQMDYVKGKDIFLYTDGLTEAENKLQNQYGEERLQALLRQHTFAGARQAIETIQEHVARYVADAEPNDDMTMMYIRIK
ncbi:MAG: SpoIIE family protein phosphatase [Prevotella sp.]|nr:SpoIIE family protein phosphatase [Prevotella sp.]